MSAHRKMIAKSGLIPVAERAGAQLGEFQGWKIPLAYDAIETEVKAARERVALVDVSAVGKLLIQGENVDEALAAQFGTVPEGPTDLAPFADGWLTQFNRTEYYSALSLDAEERAIDELRSSFGGMHAHVTSITHGRDTFALIGPDAPRTLTKLCALDFRERAFPNRRAQLSSVAKVQAMVARVDRGNCVATRCTSIEPTASTPGRSFWTRPGNSTVEPSGQKPSSTCNPERRDRT